jgi:hypothetical protein
MAIWITGTVYFAHLSSNVTTDSSPPLQQAQAPGQASPPPPQQDVVMKLQWQASKSKELIDMQDLTATLAFDNPDGGVWKQGWDVEPVSI